MKKIGIYKITNPKGKIYIGQSIDLDTRIEKYNMLYQVQKQPKIYNSLMKYGVDNHIFEVILECKEEDLNHFESYFQKKYDSVENGLNCKYQALDGKSGGMSNDIKEKIKKSNIGQKKSINIERMVKVYQYDIDGEFKEVYISIAECARLNNKKSITISTAIRGKYLCDGYYYSREFYRNNYPVKKNGTRRVLWLDIYCNVLEEFKSIQEAVRRTGQSKNDISHCCFYRKNNINGYRFKFIDEVVRKEVLSKCNRIVQMDLEDNEIRIFENIDKAKRQLGIDRHIIEKCCEFELSEWEGSRFKYVNNSYIGGKKRIQSKDLNGSVIKIFDSITEASQILGIDHGNISRLCYSGKISQKLNCRFEFVDDIQKKIK